MTQRAEFLQTYGKHSRKIMQATKDKEMLTEQENIPESAEKEGFETSLNLRTERFCLALVNTADKYAAFDLAGFESKTQAGKAAAVSRLLRKPAVKRRINELHRELMAAKGISEDRILGNLAEIAFNKKNHNVDRSRALELLGKKLHLWQDSLHITGDQEQREFTDAEREGLRKLADKVAQEAIEANRAKLRTA